MTIRLLLAILLATFAPAANAGTPLAAESGPAGPRPLRVVDVEGVPSDSTIRAEFMAGFDETLSAGTFAVEQRGGDGAWRPAGSRPNRFAREDDPEVKEAWSLQVVVRAPPPFSAKRYNRQTKKSERYVDPDLRASRGMTLALIVLSPEAIAAGARAMPEHAAFAFPQGAAPAGVVRNTAEGFRFPWRDSGRAAATLALELLHRRAGDLAEDVRCDLSPALRAESVR